MALEWWYLHGQSNSSGSSGFAAMVHPLWSDVGVQNPYAPVLLYDKIASAYADPMVWDVEDRAGVSLQGYSGGTMGTAMGLGRRLDQLYKGSGNTVGIAQCSVTGTFLAGATNHWDPNGSLPSGTNLFHIGLNQCAAATGGSGGTVVGGVYVQGEADAGNGAAASGYFTTLQSLVSAERAQFGAGYLLVLVRMNIRNFPSLALTHTVRAAEEAVAAADPLIALVETDDLPLPNGAHYDAQGYWELGNRCAEAAAQLRFKGARGPSIGSSWRTTLLAQTGSRAGETHL